MPDAVRALGTVLKIGATSAISVAGLTEISGLSLSADTIDATTLNSDGGYRQFVGGFKDGGEVSLSGYFNSTTGKGQAELYAAFESGAEEDFSIEFPADLNAKWTFKGVVTGIETGASLEDLVSFSATIKVSGKPTLGTLAP